MKSKKAYAKIKQKRFAARPADSQYRSLMQEKVRDSQLVLRTHINALLMGRVQLLFRAKKAARKHARQSHLPPVAWYLIKLNQYK